MTFAVAIVVALAGRSAGEASSSRAGQSYRAWHVVGEAGACDVTALTFPEQETKPAPAPARKIHEAPKGTASPLKTEPKTTRPARAKTDGQEADKEDDQKDEEEEDEEEDDEEEEEEPLATDRPDFTEASSVVGAGRIQWEMGYTFVRDDTQGLRVDTHSAPEVLCRIGLTEIIELRLAWNYLIEREDDLGDVSRIDGAEDLRLGTKIALSDQHHWFPESAMILQLSVPTGVRAFTNDDVTFSTSLLYGWDLPCDFSLGGSTIYANPAELAVFTAGPILSESFDRHNLFAQSVTVGIPLLGDWWRMYIEYFGIFTEGRQTDLPQNYLDGGFTWLLTNDLQLDWRAGVGLNDSADDFFTGAGIAWRY
jgi:hypothetical protein